MLAQTAPARGLHQLTATLVLAAALLGLAEVALGRMVAPALSHIPTSSLGQHIGQAADAGGASALSATALLVIAAALTFAIGQFGRDRAASLPLAAAVSATTLMALDPGHGGATAGRIVLVCAATAVAGVAMARLPRWHAAAVAVAALAVIAGQWPLVAEALAAGGGGAAADPGNAAAGVAELSLVTVPILLAFALLQERRPPRGAWVTAVAASVLSAALLAREPSYTAILSTWATGATLSLPPFLYIFAAGCAALVLASSLSERSSHHLAAGLVLLAVAGVQPALVHHNLTALLALALLATPPVRRLVAARAAPLDARSRSPRRLVAALD